MSNTINNGIPFVPENTIDPAAGLNLSLNTIDALLQLLVITVGANTPPTGVEGNRYIVGTSPTGAWSGQANKLARFLDGAWHFYSARYALNVADGLWYVRPASTWAPLAGGGGGSGDVVGPAGATNNYPALFDGTTGKLIKQGAAALGTAAYTPTTDYATAAQGTLAGTALQPAAIGTTVQAYSTNLASWSSIAPSAKQDFLVSATNIKTINGVSILGFGDLTVGGGGGSGTVTSVALTAPTGFSVGGSPITGAGTLAITFDTGYSLPTNANQSNWTTAFGWGNHGTAGYTVGPASAVNSGVALFDGTTGKLLKDGGVLGTAAFTAATAYATAAQGTLAGTALQPAAIGVSVQAYAANLTSWAALAPSAKQDALVSATNIKTINGASVLGSGDLTVGGLTNPMTAAGDIIIGGASGAPSRLAKGTDGQMLLMAAGAQAYGNNPILAGYKETLETMATNAIDVSTGNIKKRVLTTASTLTISGSSSGFSHSFTLLIEGGNTNAVTWPASFKWMGGVPTLTAKDVITGFTVDNGTTWVVSYVGSYV